MNQPESNLDDWTMLCGTAMQEKGFHDGPLTREGALVRLCLIHTEISEAAQVVKRKGINDPDIVNHVLAEELADTFIRLFDLCFLLNINIDTAVMCKMHKNMKRPHKYGTPEEAKTCMDGSTPTSVTSAAPSPLASKSIQENNRRPLLARFMDAMGFRRTNTSCAGSEGECQNTSGTPTT